MVVEVLIYVVGKVKWVLFIIVNGVLLLKDLYKCSEKDSICIWVLVGFCKFGLVGGIDFSMK